MAQLFPRRFGFFFRLGLLAFVALAVVAAFAWRATTARPAGLNDPLQQPVAFSHKHHVGDDGIDCRYCHASVETSAFAGIPPLSTCLTCHSQLFTGQPALAPVIRAFESGFAFHWQRVHQLPDFVYFDHSVHVNNGVGCASCHGPVDRMPFTRRVAPLTMQWCLECHRQPEKFLRPPERVFDLHWSADDQQVLGRRLVAFFHIDKQRLTDCSICHR
ncbi:MAG: cytochrome c family protein [Burkholderiaceae bacterium]|nr:cytochrome c family protein [Burkholderiaceae bacterium]